MVLMILLAVIGGLWWKSETSAAADASSEKAPLAGTNPAPKEAQASPPTPPQVASKVERPPAKTPRSAEPLDLLQLQQTLIAKAERTAQEGRGGADETARARVEAHLGNLKGLQQGGMGHVHPTMLFAELRLAKELDQVGISDQAADDARIATYLDGLLADLEASEDDKSMTDLVTRWRRELKHDDSFEAVVIATFGPGGTKEGLQGKLRQYRQVFASAPAPAESR